MNLRNGSTTGARVLTRDSKSHFEEGLDLILSKWTALQLAIDQEWGGHNSTEKAQYMADELLDWFYRKKRALFLFNEMQFVCAPHHSHIFSCIDGVTASAHV